MGKGLKREYATRSKTSLKGKEKTMSSTINKNEEKSKKKQVKKDQESDSEASSRSWDSDYKEFLDSYFDPDEPNFEREILASEESENDPPASPASPESEVESN